MRDPKIRAVTRRLIMLLAFGVCLFLALASSAARAQDAPGILWGQLTTTELRDRLDDDPSASASVVFDRGVITVGPGFKFTYERHRRIQIFGPAAYSLANIEIRYHNSEKIESLEGHTLTPDGRRVKLSRKHFYENKTGDLVTRVFAFPEVSPGCVIEYRYKLSSRNFYYLRPWVFQSEVPTEYSELSVRLPEGFEYEAVLNNSGFVHGPDTTFIRSLRHKNIEVREFTWRSEHLAPLIGEPCVPSLLDHRIQLDFQIVRYRDDNGKVWDFVDSWRDLAKQVRNAYKSLLRPDTDWPRWAAGDNTGGSRALARRVYQFVRDSIATSGQVYAIVGGGLRPAREVFDSRRGNELEKNLLLVALLRHNGLNAYPFLISRRTHLRFDRRDHRLYQFDHALVMLEDSGERVFCDANTPEAWLGYLPPEDLVDAGVVIGHDDIEDVVLDVPSPPAGNDATGIATITLASNGTATGRLEAEVSGRAAYTLLCALADRDTLAYFEDNWIPGIQLRSFAVSGQADDEWAPIQFTAEFDWPQAAKVSGNRIFLRPSTLRKLRENPLMTSTRHYPISFETPWQEKCRIVWNLPAGYELNELPASRNMTGNGFEFRSTVVAEGSQVIADRIWRVTQRDFPVTRFEELRELFYRVQLTQRGLLVLYTDNTDNL